MPSLDSGADENKAKGNMWALDQALDKPMDDEAGRLRDMHGERVSRFIFIFFLILRFAHYSQLVIVCSFGRKVTTLCNISVALNLHCLLGSLIAHCSSIGFQFSLGGNVTFLS